MSLTRLLKSSLALACATLTLTILGCVGTKQMNIDQDDFGQTDGKMVHLYTLENQSGMIAKITNYGAIITELHTRDRNGDLGDIVLGFDSLEEYVKDNPYFGAIVGRCANRIAKGEFRIDGKSFKLATNNGPNHLHGGIKGFDKVVWEAQPLFNRDGPALKLTHMSSDGEEGYPGNLNVTVIYELTSNNELLVEIEATADQPTPVNIVHHSYWNLAGHASGTILAQELELNSDSYTPTDPTLIPSGEIAMVKATAYDFGTPQAIGAEIAKLPGDGKDDPGGYDLNYVLRGRHGAMKFAARVIDSTTGRIMEIETTEPGIQFYSGNFLESVPGKNGATYKKHHGFCLETQHYPDSINKQGREGWPSIILRPGEVYRHKMIHRFTAK